MIKVTWEWLGQGAALDLADTVAIEDGAEHDLIASVADYERWAHTEAAYVPPALADLLAGSRSQVLELRTIVRSAMGAVAAGERPSRATISELNRISRSAPEWAELDPEKLELLTMSSERGTDRLLAWYARSTIELVAKESGRLRQCPAPSCGMYYVSSRRVQRWCSTQCGSRARVARYYAKHRDEGRG
jgi:predicted RNA-binding Zn ribbon-like protein